MLAYVEAFEALHSEAPSLCMWLKNFMKIIMTDTNCMQHVLDPTVKDRTPPPTSWSMQDYTNPQSCFRTFCYFSAHALPTLLFPIFSKMFFALVDVGLGYNYIGCI